MTPEERSGAKAEIRADLVRRLFAVAISVGFAATLTKMSWVTNGDWPDADERKQIVALITAMIATVLSWDGYLLAIKERPLIGFWRFAIDIVLVFIYMLLLMSSQHMEIFLIVLACIFLLYCAWDVLTIAEHPGKYLLDRFDGDRAPFRQIIDVYIGGVRDKGQIKKGPIVTLSWAVYFLLLAIITIWAAQEHSAQEHVYSTCVFAVAGLVLYRLDNNYEQQQAVFGFRMPVRGLIILVTLTIATSYNYLWRA